VPRAAEQAQHGEAERGLAAARLADDAGDRSPADREIDAAKDLPARRRDAQAVDRQERRGVCVERGRLGAPVTISQKP
jgi:hypothetical protein